MYASLYLNEMLSKQSLENFIEENVPNDLENYYSIKKRVYDLHKFMMTRKFRGLPRDEKQDLIGSVLQKAHEIGNFMNEIVGQKATSCKQSSNSGSPDLVQDWNKIRGLLKDLVKDSNFTEGHFNFNYLKEARIFFQTRITVENIEKKLLEITDSSYCITLNEEQKLQSRVLLTKKAFPAHEGVYFITNLCKKLENLPQLISDACKGQPLALLLIGGLLSLKPMTYDIWNWVKDDLVKIKESGNFMWDIFTYCYNDLSSFLQLCFLYFACHPFDYEIPTTSLIEIWIAEGFVEEEEEETLEETANKYLEELVQRSLVFVSRKSFSGTIRSCRVPRIIHEFAIKQCQIDGVSVGNPDQKEYTEVKNNHIRFGFQSQFHLAIHHDNKKQYTEVKNNHIRSFLAFNFDRNVLGSAVLLRVLALRNSAIPVKDLPNMIWLRYLGLRGSNISELPNNIGDMKHLQTLDVRDTSIETLPESLWNIKKLRHVYVKPSPKNKGPPSVAKILDLQILKTVAAHESWAENIPHFLIHLRKLALSNWDILDWKFISNLLSQMDKLLSMAIMGKFIPSEFVDIRAFPNLETVKSIKLEGKWNVRKLFIDYVKFPPNLTKLILTNSGLKEDPMPTLEKLQALKFLSLQDGAYIGKQMVCSANGFPQLQFLKLLKLENLEIWVVESGVDLWGEQIKAMPQLSTLRVVQCRKLNKLPNLDHVNTTID